ncbi:MAG: Maf family nucleotide pyrophosphatase, partial [Alphaproteobacteria bacterium]|nr:Maf family nucleotide pyrophosphatase [Alphaproteobacteria bacterium]
MSAPPRFILASASSRRRDLLYQIGLVPDEIIAADIDENPLTGERPAALARRLAMEKLARVRGDHGTDFVLAADTVVGLGRRILPKPSTREEARSCLQLLSGRRHHVFTAMAAGAPDGPERVRLVDSVVAFKRLSGDEVAWYLDSEEWRGKAGGYGIQGLAGRFVRFLRGSYSNVVGLPLFETANLLEG